MTFIEVCVCFISYKLIVLICRDILTYDEVREEVLKLITSSIQFTGTSGFITYIRDDGCDMQEAKEQLTLRKRDLMEDCAVVIAGKAVNLTNRYGQSNVLVDG